MKKGFMLIEVMVAIIMAGILAAVLATIGYYTLIQGNTLKQQNSKTMLEVIRSRLLNLAANPDNDSYFELLVEDANNTVPVIIGLGKDGWGRNIFYSTYDFGDANGNSTYAQNTTSISPNANVLGRLISRGEDGVLDTDENDSIAQNDDILLEIGIGETNHLKLYSGSEVSTQTRGYNSAIVALSTDPLPTSPINGMILFLRDTNVTKIYDVNTSGWIQISP
jgi:prepilin-type N-terminal cleavage/methylation domain-containing protein